MSPIFVKAKSDQDLFGHSTPRAVTLTAPVDDMDHTKAQWVPCGVVEKPRKPSFEICHGLQQLFGLAARLFRPAASSLEQAAFCWVVWLN
jgi:hypothetical protein